jgi:hypothetical protein
MKRVFLTIPMLWPRLSDKAAAQLLDVLSQLFDSVQHHYGPQARRWQRQRCRPHKPASPAQTSSSSSFDGDPF